MARETLSKLRAKLTDATKQKTMSDVRAAVADAVGPAPVEPITKSWEYAVDEYAAEHGVSKAAAMMALAKTPEGAAQYKFAIECDRIEAVVKARQAASKPALVADRVAKEWDAGTKYPPAGVSILKHTDVFLRSRAGRVLYDLHRFGHLEPLEALEALRAEQPETVAKSLQQDLGVEYLTKWASE